MQDKIVVITGASSGIGAAAAEEIVRRGGKVVLAARRHDELAAVAAPLGERAHPVVTDVTKRAEVERLCAQARAHFGGLDVWVNNAGRGITRAGAEAYTRPMLRELYVRYATADDVATVEAAPPFTMPAR